MDRQKVESSYGFNEFHLNQTFAFYKYYKIYEKKNVSL